ncbi:glutathionylspermidine synthase family protein [Paratissierella segnis]|jgi:glutathionylspermidine synthase|uniref:Glutathionylspermidine synthase family protein n=1 Tax=Paratissierella segnis TaxID=2763679 RepID=A0A926IJZ5_9FIRM|nr:glutathionylspermidine synthase family protein [Paratissierella segnis]MBC8587173.1 glutathionylspermidine synthase family protein [Paratissierella segnis]
MKEEKINKEYIDLIQSDQDRYYKDYNLTVEKVKNSNAQYKGKPIPFLYHPMFITEENIDDFNKIGDMMISIANKVTDRYVNDGEFRKKFNFPRLIEELIQIDNGYDINVPMGRFDIFYKDYDNFMFCELNTDGSSAMNEDNTIGKILLETESLKEFKTKYRLGYFELFDTWVDSSIELYKKYDPKNLKPNVAIIDFEESGTIKEFQEFQKAYVRKGYNCIIADPRDLEYRDGKLYHDQYRIDLVYRRIVTFELIEKSDEIHDFIEAYKNRAFCCIGSIKSQVIHNKIFFKILHDEDTQEFLSGEEREFIKKHIPVTGLFKGDKVVFDLVLSNKDKYILKPLDLNASQGVFAGKDLTFDEWRIKLEEIWNKDYLYQEYFEPFTRDFVVFEEGKLKIQEFKSILGLFMYKEKFAGIYTRIGKNNVISGITDYFTLPNVIVKGR